MRGPGSADDRGAVAILVALVTALALVPATALGLNSYVLAGTNAELARSADAAALAGAGMLRLVNAPVVTLPPDAAAAACAQAGESTRQDDGFASSYTVLNASGDPAVSCTAALVPDTSLQTCATALTSSVPVAGGPLTTVTDPAVLAVAQLLQAFTQPQVTVTLEWQTRDAVPVVTPAAPPVQRAVSTAQRRLYGLGVPVVPAAGLAQTKALVLSALQPALAQVASLLPGPCGGLLTIVDFDVLDLLGPGVAFNPVTCVQTITVGLVATGALQLCPLFRSSLVT